jgi:predicted oxidoreductase
MRFISIPQGGMNASEISLGCMRIAAKSLQEVSALIMTALDSGINFFEHADIYGDGKAEEVFGRAVDLRSGLRDKILIQSKCGIRPGYYDFSKEHILSSVEGSLRKLRTDYLDALLLHRPDTLVEPEEVAAAFSSLHQSGKVRWFGVSNHNPMQIELLRKTVSQKLVINQLQFSIMNTGMIDSGLHVNMQSNPSIDRDGSILEYCRLNDITIQAWSPFLYGFFEGVFLGNDKFPELNKAIDTLAAVKGVPTAAIAIAWILRHPARIQPIVGTTNPGRLRDICMASGVELSRQEWYQIYKAAGNTLP